MHVAGHDIPRLQNGGEQNVFRCTPLVCREDVAETEDVGGGVEEPLEASAAGVRLVPPHHRRPLLLAHGAGTGIGQQVNIHILCLKLEQVVACFADPLLSFTSGEACNRFDDLNAIWLERRSPRLIHPAPPCVDHWNARLPAERELGSAEDGRR